MKIETNITVTFRPGTCQLAFMDKKEIVLKPDVLKFNDGSLRVTLPITPDLDHDSVIVDCYISSMDDLMIVAQIKDIVYRNNHKAYLTLSINGTAYTRYDRVMLDDKSDAFGAKVYADFINSIGYNFVWFKDAHSNVIIDLVNNAMDMKQKHLVKITLGKELDKFGIVCPDAGAAKKLKNAIVYLDKDRDVSTGKIRGIKISDLDVVKCGEYDEFLVVDDICEGGGTFLGLADAFKNHVSLKGKKLSLYVTHGIFSNNAIPKLLEKYSKIYVYSMREDVYTPLTREQKSRISVSNLLK